MYESSTARSTFSWRESLRFTNIIPHSMLKLLEPMAIIIYPTPYLPELKTYVSKRICNKSYKIKYTESESQ